MENIGGNMLSIFRLIHAGFVLTRCGITSKILESAPEAPQSLSFFARLIATKKAYKDQNIVEVIDKLGPSYIKLAQFLATRPDIVGVELSDQLSKLQDRIPPFSRDIAIQQIAKSLGFEVEQVNKQFPYISEPIAAASIAQVHQALWHSENDVTHKIAIKIIRPDIKRRFTKDVKSFYKFAKLVERFSEQARRLRVYEVIKELDITTRKEMDMRLEAAAISEMADNTQKDKGFRVPKIYWPITGKDILSMEWIDGIKLTDKEALLAEHLDLKLLADNLMKAFLRHALRDGFFHADMHPGNLFVEKTGDIVAIDFGITGRINEKERYFLAKILYGFINRDYMLVAQAHFDAGYVPKYNKVADFAQANRAIGEPIHGQDAKNISMASLLALLFEITEIFNMQTRPELLLLQKTMVIVEGLCRDLNPDFNMWKVAQPIVEEWMIENMGPKNIANHIKKTSKNFANMMQEAPVLFEQWVDRTNSLIHHNKLIMLLLGEQTRKKHRWQWGFIFCISAIILYLHYHNL